MPQKQSGCWDDGMIIVKRLQAGMSYTEACRAGSDAAGNNLAMPIANEWLEANKERFLDWAVNGPPNRIVFKPEEAKVVDHVVVDGEVWALLANGDRRKVEAVKKAVAPTPVKMEPVDPGIPMAEGELSTEAKKSRRKLKPKANWPKEK
jgi:hypothetical protein